jgi:hypothetical protein
MSADDLDSEHELKKFMAYANIANIRKQAATVDIFP